MDDIYGLESLDSSVNGSRGTNRMERDQSLPHPSPAGSFAE